VSKFTEPERRTIMSLVASLTIKRIPESEILKEVYRQTNKTMTKQSLYNIRKRIKKESFRWYSQLREGEYEYIHEFRERINEIIWLQKKHHEIINSPTEPTSNKQSSLAELHRLNITLSNYSDVAPSIGISAISAPQQSKTTEDYRDKDIIV
jgi:hypothetical protein